MDEQSEELSSEEDISDDERYEDHVQTGDEPLHESSKQQHGHDTIFKWWAKPSIIYAFCHPKVTKRLEQLMGSNIVKMVDRDYMQHLQKRVLEVYASTAAKRIKERENREMDRVKHLVLTGKVPFSKAPPEMYFHPVMIIDRHCARLTAIRRAKIKVPKVNIPKNLYWDDTPDPPSGLSIEKGHMFRSAIDNLCLPHNRFLDISEDNDILVGYMLLPNDYEKSHYEDPQVKELKASRKINEMYELSDLLMMKKDMIEFELTDEAGQQKQ